MPWPRIRAVALLRRHKCRRLQTVRRFRVDEVSTLQIPVPLFLPVG
jgi:hypothetical protein